MAKHFLNIAILAHIDAGKTSLSEAILYTSRKIRCMGSVEEGLATLDYLPAEKERGITIETGVSSYRWKNTRVSFLDTPGHVDFSVEVDCALDAVEGAVLVLSGVRGVETQTMVSWEKLRRKEIYPLLFLNKLDLSLAKRDDVLLDIEKELGMPPVVLAFPVFEDGVAVAVVDVLNNVALQVEENGERELIKMPVPAAAESDLQMFRKDMLEAAVEFDDELMAQVLDGEEPAVAQLISALTIAFQSGRYLGCWCGSAKKNLSVRQLMNGIKFFVPEEKDGDEANVLGRVIKMRYARGFGPYFLFKALADISYENIPENCGFFSVEGEVLNPVEALQRGEVCGLSFHAQNLQLGDTLLQNGAIRKCGKYLKYEPLLHTRLEAENAIDHENLGKSLEILTKSDPSLQLDTDRVNGTWQLSTVGEVQLDVLLSRLRDEFGCRFRRGEVAVHYLEQLKTGVDPLTADCSIQGMTLSLRGGVEAWGRRNVDWRLSPELQSIPELGNILESAVHEFCHAGVLGKGQLTGLLFRLDELHGAKVFPPERLKKLVQDALRLHIRPEMVSILEPWMDLEVVSPEEYCGFILADLESRHAKIEKLDSDGRYSTIFCKVTLAEVQGYSNLLPSISKGTASYALRFYRNL